MDKLEKVEKIREKTGVSYDDAKNALEACDYDILDAIIYLEKLGKIAGPSNAVYKTTPNQSVSEEFEKAQQTYNEDCEKASFGQVVDKFLSWCGKVIKKGVETKFVVVHHGERAAEIPVLVLVLLMLIAFWVTIPLLITGGSGLGLSIAKWIIDAHDGIIEVLSRPEFGTRFTITF